MDCGALYRRFNNVWCSAHRPFGILAILLAAFFLIQSCVPLRTAVQIGADEGFELAKATLCLNGYKLYSEVWNDQPPLHTFLITQILKHIWPSVLGPRLVTSVFAAVLLVAVFFISFRVSGFLVAALATALLLVSPGFVELSSSCMLEIPALAPALAALGVLLAGLPKTNREGATLSTHAQPLLGRGADKATRSNSSPLGRSQEWVRLRQLLGADSTPGCRIKSPVGEIIAGVLFGAAFQIKLVSVILLPLAVLIVWLLHRATALPRSAGVRSLLFLAASLAISFVTIDYLIDSGAFLLHFHQSWSSHFASAKSFEYGSPNDHPFDWSIFLKNWDTTVAALFGIVVLLWANLPVIYSRGRMQRRLDSPSRRLSPPRSYLFSRSAAVLGSSNVSPPNTQAPSLVSPASKAAAPEDGRTPLKKYPPAASEKLSGGRVRGQCGSAVKSVLAMVPLAWLGLTLIVFSAHKPWWSYYYIHLAIPLCWCAAIGVEAAWRWIHRRHLGLSLLLGVFAICAVGWMGSRVYLQISGIRHSPQTYSSLVLGEIQRLKPFAKFIYTDESIYSFHAGIPMAPDLAVLPLKRLWSGDMTNARVAEEMKAIKPEVILLRNDAREVPFQELLDAQYRVVYQDAQHRLYTQRALAKQAGY
jgi:hypothetical protein